MSKFIKYTLIVGMLLAIIINTYYPKLPIVTYVPFICFFTYILLNHYIPIILDKESHIDYLEEVDCVRCDDLEQKIKKIKEEK